MTNLNFNFTIRQTSLLLFLIVNLVSAAFIPRKLTRPHLDQAHNSHPIAKRSPLPLPVPQDILGIVPTPPAGGGEVVPTPPPSPPPEAVPTPPPGGGNDIVPTPPPGGQGDAVPSPPPSPPPATAVTPLPEPVTPLPPAVTPILEPVTPLPPAVTPIEPAITPIPDSGAGNGGTGETPVVVTPAVAKRTDGPRVTRWRLF